MSHARGLFAAGEDEAPLVAPRKIADGELDITPMIDVTFLLLIFFMVGSTMQTAPDVDLPVANYGVGVDTLRATTITVLLEKTAAGETPVIEMEQAGGNTIRTDLDGVRRRVAELVSANRRRFIIKAERHVPHGTIQELTRTITEVEGARFFIGVHEREAK
jgi:biopolymer transport protein ExbD